jgi:hypothetical protein
VATRKFALNTEPHVAEIGDTKLLFQAEVYGDQFLDAYEKLRTVQKEAKADDPANADPAEIRKVTNALRDFLSSFMLPESRDIFAQTRLPDRILVDLLEWTVEQYGARPTGSSSGSAAVSPSRGTRGSATSPSKASTRTRGR